jgi:ribosomal protein S18 acetylase RimI-like enzyme
MSWSFRRVRREDAVRLSEIARATVTTAPLWTAAQFEEQLFNVAHGDGEQSWVCCDGDPGRQDRVLGVVGWVRGGESFFASPLCAERVEVAQALLDRVPAEARGSGARWIRCGGGRGSVTVTALASRGYAHQFDFVDLALRLEPGESAAPAEPRAASGSWSAGLPAGFVAGPALAAEREPLRLLYNRAFEGAPNSLPLSPEMFAEELGSPRFFAPASFAVTAPSGDYAAFVFCVLDQDDAGRYAIIEAVGVDAPCRRRGLAAVLERAAIAACRAAAIPEVRALVATSNVASFELHRALGFTEKHRRQIWQLDL